MGSTFNGQSHSQSSGKLIGRECDCLHLRNNNAIPESNPNKPKSSNGFVIDKGFKASTPKKTKKQKLHCCSIDGCLSSKGSLIKFSSTHNGNQYFSHLHKYALKETLRKFNSNVNCNHFIDIITSHLQVGPWLDEYCIWAIFFLPEG